MMHGGRCALWLLFLTLFRETAACQDYTLSGGDVWNIDGATCDDLELIPDSCDSEEEDEDGWYTAYDACCFCGGGFETDAPGTRVPAICVDHTLQDGSEWHLGSRLLTCEVLGQDTETNCANRMTDRDRIHTTRTACCVCGGGAFATRPPETAEPLFPPTPAPPTEVPVVHPCTDHVLSGGSPWVHSNLGKTCADVVDDPPLCNAPGTDAEMRFTTKQACCECGGGVATAAPDTAVPTDAPTGVPTSVPTSVPTAVPTGVPAGVTSVPTAVPTAAPTDAPVGVTSVPTSVPTDVPTAAPTSAPTDAPSLDTQAPTAAPTPPTDAPDSNCSDHTLLDGSEWEHKNSHVTCEDVAGNTALCRARGKDADGNYTTAEACCVCGGGDRETAETAAPATANPTGSPLTTNSPDAVCADHTLFDGSPWTNDLFQKTCEDVSDALMLCDMTGTDVDGNYTASEACCVCGGGVTTVAPQTMQPTTHPTTDTPSTSTAPTDAPDVTCSDHTLSNGSEWVHAGLGTTCDDAADMHLCNTRGTDREKLFTLAEACCVCGGGLRATDAPDTDTPETAAPPTAEPTEAPKTLPPRTLAPKTDAPPTAEPTAAPPTAVPTRAPPTPSPPTPAPPTAQPTLSPTQSPPTPAPDTAVPTAAPPTTSPPTPSPPTPSPPTPAPDTPAPPTVVPFSASPATLTPTATPPTTIPDTFAPKTLSPPTDNPATVAPETNAPETAAPITRAPETQAPKTSAPQTDAPMTDVPQTNAPETRPPRTSPPRTDAPVTIVPTTSPNTIGEVTWCDNDAGCTEYGDTAAVCTSGRCVCSDGYYNPVSRASQETLYVCVASDSETRRDVTLRLVWDVSCDASTRDVESAVSTAIESATKGRVGSLTVSCGSTIYVVGVKDADVVAVLENDLAAEIADSLRSSTAAVNAGFVGKMSVSTSVIQSVHCSVPGASQVMMVLGKCTATACQSGYTLTSSECVEDTGGTTVLSNGAAIGVIVGGVLCAMVVGFTVFVLYLRRKERDEDEEEEEKTAHEKSANVDSKEPIDEEWNAAAGKPE